MRKIFMAIIMVMSSLTLSAQEKANDVDWLKSLLSRFKFNGYAQAGYTWTAHDGSNTNTLDLKRTLLWVKADITDRWSFLFMHDFSSEVQEFYTDYRITRNKALTVRFGQFKHHFSMENPLSPTKLELVNVYSQGVTFLAGCGSDPLFGVQYGRDLGVSIYGQLFDDHLFYNLELMNGQGINKKDKNNQKDVILSLDFRPVDNLRLVATGQLGTGHAVATSKYNPDIAVGENYKRNRWSAGAEWKSHLQGVDYWKNRCATIHGEVLGGKDGEAESFGAYATASVPVVDKLDVVGSVDYFNYNTELGMKQTNCTVGVQYWFYRTCRAQVQYTIANPAWEKHSGILQAQMQVAF